MTCSRDQKVTTMILKVDLQCCRCYLKIKKILCKFPQIRDQVFDEKQNTVTITVVCCSPERIMDKLCRKGRKTIKSIEIKEPAPPQKPPKSKPAPPNPPAVVPEPVKPKPDPAPVPILVPVPVPAPKPEPAPKPAAEPQKAAPAPVPAPRPRPAPEPVAQWVPSYPPQVACCGSCYEGRTGGPCYQYGRPPCPPGYPPQVACCGSCYEGRTGGPCYQYGRPPCPPGYFNEENPSACAIM